MKLGIYTMKERWRVVFPVEDTAWEKCQTVMGLVWYYVLPGVGLVVLIVLGLVKLWRALL